MLGTTTGKGNVAKDYWNIPITGLLRHTGNGEDQQKLRSTARPRAVGMMLT